MLIYIQTSIVQINLSRVGCILGVFYRLGSLYANRFLCISVLRVASGPRVKLVSCKSALNLPVVYSTDRSKAVVPVLVLLLVAL